MIRLGAYRKGAEPAVDESIDYHDAIESFLAQKPHESCTLQDGYQQLAKMLTKRG